MQAAAPAGLRRPLVLLDQLLRGQRLLAGLLPVLGRLGVGLLLITTRLGVGLLLVARRRLLRLRRGRLRLLGGGYGPD